MTAIPRAYLGGAAALAIVVASAAYLTWYGEPPQDFALTRPSGELTLALQTSMPTIRFFAALISSRLRELIERWTVTLADSVRGVDERTLAEIRRACQRDRFDRSRVADTPR